MHEPLDVTEVGAVGEPKGLDDLVVDLLIEEARELHRRRRRFRRSAAIAGLALAAVIGLLISAGSANPGRPGARLSGGSNAQASTSASALPGSCTQSYDLTPQGALGAAPSGPAVLDWTEATFSARYPSVWGGSAMRQVANVNHELANAPSYRVTVHDDQLEREVRIVEPEATFAVVPYSEACLQAINADLAGKVQAAPLTTWQVWGVGMGYSRVQVQSSACFPPEVRALRTWLYQRYGDRVALSSCEVPPVATPAIQR